MTCEYYDECKTEVGYGHPKLCLKNCEYSDELDKIFTFRFLSCDLHMTYEDIQTYWRIVYGDEL